jgi:ABC-type dipeptide/oligopeptide/nickel transport system ATPase subunit
MSTVPGIALQMTGVNKRFGSNSTGSTVVKGMNLLLDQTSSLGVVGESGSGKSTTARMLVGLEQPTSGTVEFDGVDLKHVLSQRMRSREFRRAVQFVGQDTTSTFDPRRTLLDSISFPAQRLCGSSAVGAREEAEEIVQRMGLDPALASRRPHEVSGGQRQRFALARALVVKPRLLICDEVVSALDVSVQGTILNLLKVYCKTNEAGLVFVSHGLPATAFVADELLVMYRGDVVERGRSVDMVDRPNHPYTRSLLDAYHGLGSGDIASDQLQREVS